MNTTCSTHLGPDERATLSLGLAQGHSLRMMTRVLSCAPSILSRECVRTAQTQAVTRACQPRRPRKLVDSWLWQSVQTHLKDGCSPEQSAGRLRRAYPDDMAKQLHQYLPKGTV